MKGDNVRSFSVFLQMMVVCTISSIIIGCLVAGMKYDLGATEAISAFFARLDVAMAIPILLVCLLFSLFTVWVEKQDDTLVHTSQGRT